MIAPREHTIVISPISDLDADTALLDRVGREVDRVFGFQTEVVTLLEERDLHFDEVRMQYHSTPILEKLSALAPPKAIKVLAITKVDLFIPILTHVYGEAQLGGKACMISIHRLKEGLPSRLITETYHHRIVKEAIHELGHTFKLRHCRDQTCIMHYCHSVKDVDRKSDQLCRYCKILLDDEIKKLAGK